MGTANSKYILSGVVVLLAIIIIGSYGISELENIPYEDAVYYVALLVTTVGVEMPVTTDETRFMILFFLAVGMGLVLYIAVTFASMLIEGHTRALLGGLKGGLVKMRKEKNHTIVCGYGRLGKYVCSVLKEKKEKYLIVERNADVCKELVSHGEPVLQGDSLKPEVLKKAGIARARGLIGTLGEDSENMYLLITASEINPNLDLAAKAEEEHAVDRLHRVGAKIVVLPQVVGGRQLADAFLQLEKSEVLETISKKK